MTGAGLTDGVQGGLPHRVFRVGDRHPDEQADGSLGVGLLRAPRRQKIAEFVGPDLAPTRVSAGERQERRIELLP
ncbi:hypothetical protein ACWGII_09680 [Streptomyces sp. NPDC054855]